MLRKFAFILLVVMTLSSCLDVIFGSTSDYNPDLPTMIYVAGGTYQMGSDIGYSDHQPPHDVTLDSFYISKYEITQEQWDAGEDPQMDKAVDLIMKNE